MLHAISRTARIAGVAALAGLMMTVAIVSALHQPEAAPPTSVAGPGDAHLDRLARELDRCATLTMPDSGCETAWAENRRRFFRQPAPAADGDRGSTAPAQNTAP